MCLGRLHIGGTAGRVSSIGDRVEDEIYVSTLTWAIETQTSYIIAKQVYDDKFTPNVH